VEAAGRWSCKSQHSADQREVGWYKEASFLLSYSFNPLTFFRSIPLFSIRQIFAATSMAVPNCGSQVEEAVVETMPIDQQNGEPVLVAEPNGIKQSFSGFNSTNGHTNGCTNGSANGHSNGYASKLTNGFKNCHTEMKSDILGSAKKVNEETPYTILEEPNRVGRPVRVITIGAGASALNFAHDIDTSPLEIQLVMYEKNPELGGTWFENKYPGCACDIPSVNYQLSWAPSAHWSS